MGGTRDSKSPAKDLYTSSFTSRGLFKFALHVIILCLTTTQICADEFCEAGTGTAPFTLSDYIKTAFSAELYALDSSTNSASWLYEHYSVLAQKSALYISRPDDNYMYYWIYDLQTNTGVADSDGQGCVALSIYQPLGLTEFDTEQATYVGTETVNGEPLHLWRQCDTDYAISRELYTTGATDDWSNPQGKDYQPVMLRRKQKDIFDQIVQITYFVLYYSVRDDDDSLAADLEPPLGAVCPIQAEVDLPALPSTMIYSQELVADPRHPETFILDTERLETIIDKAGPSVLDSQREIDSYEQGMVYLLPLDEDNPCVILTYDILAQDLETSAGNSYSVVFETNDPFQSVAEFLGWAVDGFTFSGEYKLRGIPCYAYSMFYDNYYAYSDQDVTLVLFYAKDDVELNSIYGNAVPLIAKYIYFWNDDGTRYVTQEHLFDSAELDYSRLTYDPLDISMCAGKLEGTAEFGLILESSAGDSGPLTPDEEFNIKDAVRMSLSAAVGIDELRILPAEVGLSGADITVLGTVFGGVTADQAFLTLAYGYFPSTYVIPDDDIINSVYQDSVQDCEDYAHGSESSGAVFASYCSATNLCTTYSVYHLSELIPDSSSTDCVYMTYAVDQTGPLTADDTWDALVSAYTTGDLVQILDYTITSLVRTDPDPNEANDPAISDYSSVPGRVSSAVATYDNYDLTSCAQLCTESLTYECQQFTYCDKLKQCTLNPQDANPYIEADDDCYFYTRNYLSEFTAYPGTSGLTGTEMIYEEIEEPNDCAHLCLDLTDFRCESFEFCSLSGGGSGTCSLGNTHYYDADQMTAIDDVSCTHYSRSYLGDYERFDGVTDLAIAVEIQDSTPEECAKLCSEESESSEELCVMFQFCETNMACQLIDPKAVVSEAIRRDPDVHASGGCATYSLLGATDLTHGRSTSSSQAISASSDSNGGLYGAESMAAIAIIMLVIGVALVFLTLWLSARKPHLLRYGWWRNRLFKTGTDEMTMTFSKAQENS